MKIKIVYNCCGGKRVKIILVYESPSITISRQLGDDVENKLFYRNNGCGWRGAIDDYSYVELSILIILNRAEFASGSERTQLHGF